MEGPIIRMTTDVSVKTESKLERSEISLKWWKKKKKLSARMSMSSENILQKWKWKKYIFKQTKIQKKNFSPSDWHYSKTQTSSSDLRN